jgi:hypothetical protein
MNFSLNLIKFEDIRNEIVAFLKENSEYSSQFDFTGANISLIVDTMSYVTMLMSYQLSNTANNMFLDSTTLRKNAVSIAKTMGYRPQRPIASKIYGTIEYYDDGTVSRRAFTTDDKITIPAYTPFITDTGYNYINLEDINLTLDAFDTNLFKAEILLYEGTLKQYSYLGNNNPFQTFTIPSTKVSEEFFDLKVRKNNEVNGATWSEVKQSFNLLGKNSYFVEEDLNTEGYVRVVFGDGIVSNFPKNTEIVDVYYIETSADLANNSRLITLNESAIKTSLDFPLFDMTKFRSVTTTTGASYGGNPIESLEVIQAKAPKSFANAGRAVTQYDYKNILASNPSVFKSTSIGGDTLYPGDSKKLGNIYLSAIPYITDIHKNFWNLVNSGSNVYIGTNIEAEIFNMFENYKVIGTQINFLKPSYVGVDITPFIELNSNISQTEKNLITKSISGALQAFYEEKFSDFSPTFRSSRINGIISETSGVVSSYFNADYYFALGKNSLYELYNAANNVVFLPVVITEFDNLGNPLKYDNFIKTNSEQKNIMVNNGLLNAVDSLPIDKHTIYGKIATDSGTSRFIYNDDINEQYSNIKLYGKNDFFSIYRLDSDVSHNLTPVVESLSVSGTLVVTPSPSAADGIEEYTLVHNGTTLGTVKNTYNKNYGFKGVIEKEADIINETAANGEFYRVVKNITVSGSNNTFSDKKLYKDDVVMFNTLLGSSWESFTSKGDISAVNDSTLPTTTVDDIIYSILGGTSGNFGGLISSTVSGGDYLIFNSLTPDEWNVLNLRVDTVYNFDPTTHFVKEVVDYEIKKIVGLDDTSTTFNGRLNTPRYDNDLIYFNPTLNDWVLITNTVSSSITDTVIANPVSGGSLSAFDYDTLPIGTTLAVSGVGDFGDSSDRINWPSTGSAWEGDILLYVGAGKWNIWQESLPSIFTIDGTVISDLPIKMAFGDTFLVTGSGNFLDDIVSSFTNLDMAVYLGHNSWMKHTSSGFLNPSTSAGLPNVAVLGDMFRIVEDGTFSNSALISPLGEKFVQGDYIIFNGIKYVKVNEYTFEYADGARTYLNNIDLNSVFHYEFDPIGRKYTIYFEDIFDGKTIGTFQYKSSQDGVDSLFDVGKIKFEKSIKGSNDLQSETDNIPLRNIFDDTTINKIRILPKNKVDINGLISTEQSNNFDTNFNTFLIANTNEVVLL